MVNVGLLLLFVLMTLLLVMFIGAVIVAPLQAPDSGRPHRSHATVPPLTLPGRPPPTPPTRPVPRRQPPPSAPAGGFHGWSGADQDTNELSALESVMHDRIPGPEVSGGPPWELMYDRIPRPEVSGGPPWGPAPTPPGIEQTGS